MTIVNFPFDNIRDELGLPFHLASAPNIAKDGVTASRYQINYWLTTLSAAGVKEVVVNRYDFVIDDDLTIPAGLTLRFTGGGRFLIASGKTVTVNGQVINDNPHSWYTGPGVVVYSTQQGRIYTPEDFGAVGDAQFVNGSGYTGGTITGTDDTVKLQAMLDAIPDGSIVELKRKYKTSSRLTLAKSIEFRGAGGGRTAEADNKPGIFLVAATQNEPAIECTDRIFPRFNGVQIVGSGDWNLTTPTVNGIGVKVALNSRPAFQSCSFLNLYKGIETTNSGTYVLNDCQFEKCVHGFYMDTNGWCNNITFVGCSFTSSRYGISDEGAIQEHNLIVCYSCQFESLWRACRSAGNNFGFNQCYFERTSWSGTGFAGQPTDVVPFEPLSGAKNWTGKMNRATTTANGNTSPVGSCDLTQYTTQTNCVSGGGVWTPHAVATKNIQIEMETAGVNQNRTWNFGAVPLGTGDWQVSHLSDSGNEVRRLAYDLGDKGLSFIFDMNRAVEAFAYFINGGSHGGPMLYQINNADLKMTTDQRMELDGATGIFLSRNAVAKLDITSNFIESYVPLVAGQEAQIALVGTELSMDSTKSIARIISATSTPAISGFAPGRIGQLLSIVNNTGVVIPLNRDDGAAQANARLFFPATTHNMSINYGAAWFVYAPNSRWWMLGHNEA